MISLRHFASTAISRHVFVYVESVRDRDLRFITHAPSRLRMARPGAISYGRAKAMPRLREGSILEVKTKDKDGKERVTLYARVTFTDPETGRRVERKKKAETKTEAKRLIRKMLRDIEDHGEKAVLNDRMTFGQLADFYEKNYLIPPVYREGRKVAGLRNHKKMAGMVKTLKEHFGVKRLRSITYGDLDRYRIERLTSESRRGGHRSIATVNREMSQLRRLLKVAIENGWLIRDPFKMGKPLISGADERGRERVLLPDEEERLLSLCEGRRAHLRPLLICALDTGMRRGEMLKLRWQDVDLEKRVIYVEGMHTKTMRPRLLPITERLAVELASLWQKSTQIPTSTVFGFRDHVKRSFKYACDKAGIADLRWHDLRHSFATRLIERGMSAELVGQLLGHTQPKITRRYINVTPQTIEAAATLLNEMSKDDELIN